MITIYTDGSSRGNPGPGGWGAIVIAPQKVVEIGGREDHTTNNRMELMAAIKALKLADTLSDEPIEIYTDSEYVMKGITLWIHSWVKRNWRTASKKPVLNQDLWQELLKIKEGIEDLPAGRQVEWKYVAGHSGHDFNERCDVIATSFADDMAISLYNGPRKSYKAVL
jgi:ribonuclease HI